MKDAIWMICSVYAPFLELIERDKSHKNNMASLMNHLDSDAFFVII